MCIHEDGLGFLNKEQVASYREEKNGVGDTKAWAERQARTGDAYFVRSLSRRNPEWWTDEEVSALSKAADEFVAAHAEAIEENWRRKLAASAAAHSDLGRLEVGA